LLAGVCAWQLLVSLVLFEVLVFKLVLDLTGFNLEYVVHHPSELLAHMAEQRWYVAVPWVTGAAIGSLVAAMIKRTRQPSGESPSAD